MGMVHRLVLQKFRGLGIKSRSYLQPHWLNLPPKPPPHCHPFHPSSSPLYSWAGKNSPFRASPDADGGDEQLEEGLQLPMPEPATEIVPAPNKMAENRLHPYPYRPQSPPPPPSSASSLSSSSSPSPSSSWLDMAWDVRFPQEVDPAVESSATPSSQMSVPFCEPSDIYIPVKAVFISRQINLKTLAEEEFAGTIFSRNSLIIKWEDRPPGYPPKPGLLTRGSWSSARYMVAFSYGSVVFFNFGDKEEDECISIVKKHCMNLCEEAKTEDFDILVRPTMDGWSLKGHDKVILKKLNTDNISIVSSVLGQSIALEQYGREVDEMVRRFSEMNQVLYQTGKFQMKPEELFKLVAHANTTLAEVLLNLAILERSDAAWKHANYAALWEYLREEFELVQRFEFFGFKNDIIRHNVGFFLDVLQNKKSDALEWAIIVLIALEICVSIFSILHQFNFFEANDDISLENADTSLK